MKTNKRRETSPKSGSTRTNQNKRQPNGSEDNSDSTPSPLHETFLEEVADVHNAEQQLLKALPKMAEAAQSDELREAFENHLGETKEHVERLEQAMSAIGESLKNKKCKAMEGLLAEGKEMMEDHAGEPSLDAVLIAAAQKVEHYEIASYGTLAAWAGQLGHDEALDLFTRTLEEEKAADEKLTEIAENLANAAAEEEEA
jgi:ferritin-like metal-binding protein YciE